MVALKIFTALLIALAALACTAPQPTPAPTVAPAAAVVPTPTATASPTDTPTPQPTPTATTLPPTATATPTSLPTNTPAPTATPQPTAAPIPAPTSTPRPTNTPRPTSTPTPQLAALREIQQLPWVVDGVADDEEAHAIKYLRVTAQEAPEQARRMLELSWVQDGITADEALAIEFLRWGARNAPALAGQMLEFLWMQDGITADEALAIAAFSWAATDTPTLASLILELPWIQGDITANQAQAIASLSWTARDAPMLASLILEYPWVQDDISRDEAEIIRRLDWLARTKNETTQLKMADVTTRIADMSFLDDVTFGEVQAVVDLYKIARGQPDIFRSIMSHPKVQDGITDQEAKVVSILRTPAIREPEMIPHLLNGLDGSAGVYLEERIIQLPLTGETLLTIVRTQDQTTASMGYLEHAVRFAEKFMAAPLPTNYVALYFRDATGQTYGAHNWWTHMAMRQSSDGPERKANVFAHEVGHYYFRSPGPRWIHEGAAELITFVSEYERAGYPLETHLNRPCDHIKTLPASDPEEHKPCAYYLGGAFFIDLYRTLGEDDFLRGFRALHRMRLVDNPDDDCFECTELNVHYVLDAFTSNVPEDVAAKAKEVLLKWYGPLP